jgi:hypothetical protein
MQGQLQQQKQVPPEYMIMAQHMQQQLTGMGMLQNALAAGINPGVGGGAAASLPPGLTDSWNAVAQGLMPLHWIQPLPTGLRVQPGGAGELMPPSGIPMFGGPGQDVPGQAVKQQVQQQQQLQQAAAQLAAASAAVSGGPLAAAQFAAALQAQQMAPGPGGSTPQPLQNATSAAQNPSPGAMPALNPMATSRWPDGVDMAMAVAGFWPGLGGGAAPSASGRLPGLTGLGMSGITPMAGLSVGQGQTGGVGMAPQGGLVGLAPSVGGGGGVDCGEGGSVMPSGGAAVVGPAQRGPSAAGAVAAGSAGLGALWDMGGGSFGS